MGADDPAVHDLVEVVRPDLGLATGRRDAKELAGVDAPAQAKPRRPAPWLARLTPMPPKMIASTPRMISKMNRPTIPLTRVVRGSRRAVAFQHAVADKPLNGRRAHF